MKKIAFMTAVACFAIPAMAENASTPNENCKDKACCDKSACCDKAAAKDAACNRCGDECWLNIETVTLEAANGDPLAQYTIAWLTDTGNGVEQDSDKAAELYGKALPGLQKAADEGNPGACLALARMYADGKGVEKNPEMVKKYLEMFKACRDKAKAEAKDKAEASES